MELTTIWFCAIAFLWVGYLVLEGFDFGVGIWMAILGRNDNERRVVLNTIGPVWDGNEVWVIVAGGAMFAAFPEWYATLFSGFYLPLFAILVALILRATALEYRGKRDDPAWRRRWDWCIVGGSLVPAVLWGVALANIVRGVPIDADHEYVGTLFDLLNPYALLGGLATLTLFMTHGAVFIALKTTGDVRARANRAGIRVGALAVLVGGAFMAWTVVDSDAARTAPFAVAAAVALVLGLLAAMRERDGWAFAGTAVTIGLVVVMLFVALFPDVMTSSLDSAYSLTTDNASATPYTLRIMTWSAVVFVPLVLLYQGWSYWVFRKRIGTENIPA
ncbi:cytochrome d ubiquinol oxidase subunit II [Solicola gregarius]|uniref:Cytochrome d ubiquinol oxidase subunit II n=1 Tax=Solicola gregarius TaxID=2908642 RepID=A0AA46TFT6_9ACTN|nr:cytochrome d ubiquinol oxidase subunit II [Solicola gregarius]UYM04370.1 cytochrome d ubiquinol oxidase subunit II [Solicola gregarius]